MNRGGSSPSAAASYLLCTNCRKVLRKVRARLGAGPEGRFLPAAAEGPRGLSAGPPEGGLSRERRR